MSNLPDVLKQSYTNLIEGLTGLTSSKKNEVYLSAGHFLQRLRSTNLIEAFQHEWNVLRDKGRIADDYQNTEQFLNNLHELLDFLEKDIPDEVRFKILKKIILVAAQETITDRHNLLPSQFIKIAKSMSSGEILVLLTSYKIIKENLVSVSSTHYSAGEWLQTVAHHSGLDFPELVESFEEELIKKKLISERTHVDKSGVNLGRYYRITNLGSMFCNFISEYEEV